MDEKTKAAAWHEESSPDGGEAQVQAHPCDAAAVQAQAGQEGLISLEVWVNSFDRLYRKTDQLYYEMARDCGIPESAYWLMYAIFSRGGSMPVRDISETCGYTKQTVNSALRKLEEKGLVETSFCEGSRKAKQVTFTELGHELSQEQIVPANIAERRAFQALTPTEQADMLRLIDKYVAAVEDQIAIMKGQSSK